jgi:hypothetical protein
MSRLPIFDIQQGDTLGWAGEFPTASEIESAESYRYIFDLFKERTGEAVGKADTGPQCSLSLSLSLSHTHTHTHTHTHVCLYKHIYTGMYMYIYVYIYVYIICIYIYIYIACLQYTANAFCFSTTHWHMCRRS